MARELLPRALKLAGTVPLLIAVSEPAGAETFAGSTVTNVAHAIATVGQSEVAASSNTENFLVAERLDVALEQPGRPPAQPVSGSAAIPVLLTNRGNGNEAFLLVLSGTVGLSLRGIAIDADGDGVYDPSRDTLLTSGTSPAIGPGATIPLLLLTDGSGGTVTLVARSATGSGSPGTIFAGKGDGGADAETGATGAQARLTISLDDGLTPELRKTQSVRASDGTDRPEPGAVVTYRIQATFPSARRAARIDDPLPKGVSYLPGSLLLDGTELTDAADGDAGAFDGSAVTVTLGDIAGSAAKPVTRILTFQAILQ